MGHDLTKLLDALEHPDLTLNRAAWQTCKTELTAWIRSVEARIAGTIDHLVDPVVDPIADPTPTPTPEEAPHA